ncbi:MAG: hypothetical protein ABL933_15235 [Methyloglobulus sp.]|nr:hypothetical protein [Methyloglobulus sp.]
MKKLLVVVGLLLAAFSFQAGAATITLDGAGTGSGFFGQTVKGAFTTDWEFTVAPNGGGSAHLGNTYIKGKGSIVDFAATLDGIAFAPEFDDGANELHLPFFAALTPGLHHLIVSGTGIVGKTASYSGTLIVAQTPIPAAVWLFGSALVGLVGAKRRKAA